MSLPKLAAIGIQQIKHLVSLASRHVGRKQISPVNRWVFCALASHVRQVSP
jgi:hypothetical protein